MAGRIRAFDWSATPLGPIESWPQSLRTAVDIMLASPDAVSVMWGSDLTQLYNDAYIPVAAARHPDALGRPAAVNWAEAYPSFLGPLLDRAFSGEAVVVHEQRVTLIGGEGRSAEHVFNATFSPVRDETGAVAGVFHPLVEVTEQVQAEAAMRETSRRLDAILNNTRQAVFLMDHQQHCVYANAAAEQLTGYTLAEMRGCPLHDVVHHKRPDGSHYPLEECPIDRAFPERAQMSGEELFVHKDGSFYPVAFTASPLLNESGEPVGTVIEVRNIAEEKAREAALRELHETLERRVEEAVAARREADALYRAYFENTPEALFVIAVGADGGFLVEQINRAHEAGVGFKLEEVRGKRVDEILPAEAAARVIETYRHVIETGALYQYREVFDLDGNPQHWDTSLVPVRDATGRIVKLIGSSRNVTRQVVAEEALRQAQKMEAMGSLTGGVAHDFNNLLTPIIGSLDMLQRKRSGDEREQRLLAGALQSAEKAKTLVQRLLAFARRQPLQPLPVDVARLVRDMAEIVSSTTGPQIQVVVEAPANLPAAEADPNQLEMALLNLSVNARDAMPAGGTLRISASAEKVSEGHPSELRPGRYICLSVADTGTGMDEATLTRAVEPFFSTKGIGKGTGLGLSMVHGLAAQLGGALTIQSRPGLGTNVELWLPQSTDAAGAAEARLDAGRTPAAIGTALLVEDEELVRASTADMLTELGYVVHEAESAEEALALTDRGLRFDLLVTDHLMPGMTGTELAHELRARWPDLPVLVVSGYDDTDGLAPDLPRLSKPFRQADLAAKLADLATPAAE